MPKRQPKDSEGEENPTTPTATESVLPWKRGDDDGSENGAVKQNEFPAWVSNKEYLAYNSPSATFLGKVFFNMKFIIFQLYLNSFFFIEIFFFVCILPKIE